MIAKGMDAEGKPTLIQFTATRDGKDYPYTGSSIIDTVSLTPVDTFTLTFVTKKDGNVALTGTRVISNDGKMMTLSSKGTNPKGQPVENTAVYGAWRTVRRYSSSNGVDFGRLKLDGQ